MNDEVFAALIGAVGVAVGVTLSWGLQEFSSWFKSRKVEKRELGALIAELLRFHREFVSFSAQLRHRATRTEEENRADRAGNHTFSVTTTYLYQHEKLSSAIAQTKAHIAGRDPTAAMRLDDVQEALQQLNNHQDATKDEWLFRIGAALAGFSDSEADLKRLILVLARTHGLLTWVRVRRVWERDPTDMGGWTWRRKKA